MVDIVGMRAWCDSVEEIFQPRERLPKGEIPRQIPETFLAATLRFLRCCCDEMEKEKRS
jgi:hypothetical protein